MRNIIVSSIAISMFVGFVTAGCSSKNEAGPRVSQKGEACQTSADCASTLSCVPRTGGGGGLCVKGEFNVSTTAKECVVVQCKEAHDCCPTPPASINCSTLDTNCNNGSTSACSQYRQYCACSEAYTCESGTCRSQCTSSSECAGGQCVGGKCVSCSDDSDCSGGRLCNSGRCEDACVSDTDCPSFNRCSSGRCVDSGCKSNRECVAATRNVEAVCKDTKCVVPCQTDLECGTPNDYKFFSCISNQCVYVGCESDKECQLYLGTTTGATTGKSSEVVCRDKKKTL